MMEKVLLKNKVDTKPSPQPEIMDTSFVGCKRVSLSLC